MAKPDSWRKIRFTPENMWYVIIPLSMWKDSQTGLFTGQGYFFSLVFFIVMRIMPGDLLLLENCDIIIKIYYNSQYMMISGAKGQKAVHACMIRLLNLGPWHHHMLWNWHLLHDLPESVHRKCRVHLFAHERDFEKGELSGQRGTFSGKSHGERRPCESHQS